MTLAVSAMPNFLVLNIHLIFIIAFMTLNIYNKQISNIKILFEQKQQMSIYSGFAIRNQQQVYDYLLYDLVTILSKRILKTYTGQQTDQQRFFKILTQVFTKLSFMEKQKYLQPNMSTALYPIIQHILGQVKTPGRVNSKKQQWVRIRKQTQQQSHSQDAHKNIEIVQSRRTNNIHFHIPNKNNHLNPQIKQIRTLRLPKSSLQNSVSKKAQVNPQRALDSRQQRKKHQSLRHFGGDQLNEQFCQQMSYRDKQICPNCKCSKVQQKSAKIQHKSPKTSRIAMPQLVKQYIESTNRTYMKNFRKRKIKFGSQYI